MPERLVRILAAAAVAAAIGVVALLVVRALREAGQLPEGPVPIAFDRTACAHCRMLIGEAAFAAQLQEQGGRVHDFDDPGCLLRFEAERRPAVHARWFHHLREQRWLSGDEVAFAEVTPTPMGYGLGAVEAGTPGALSLEAARRQVEERTARHRGQAAPAPAEAGPPSTRMGGAES
jgi:hypothetical protein